MKIVLSCLLLILMLSTSIMGVLSLSLDGATLLSLVRHWKMVPPSIKSSWNASDSTPCYWLGVDCNRHNYIVGLNLSSLGISGQLGPEIAYLKHLRSIDLSINSFSGLIPSQLGNCSLLETLELSTNSFSGEIPEGLGYLPRLQYLSLWDNSFVGEIPDSLGNCSSLQVLYLSDNLLEGVLSDSLNNLERLVALYVDSNNLEGKIPLGLGSCKGLEILVLSNNHFSGGLPEGLGNCSSLTSLAAVNCSLTGHIPSSLGQLTELTLLYLSENHFSGEIPPELGDCKNLIDLQMYENQLEGMIPRELGMLNKLQTLMLFTNRLSGEIPISIWKIQSLENLMVYQNNLVGELPIEITELKQLRNISLFDNQFTGVIPQGLGINSSLAELDFTRNKFTGPIPPNLCFRKQLRKLILGQNHFQGNIPFDVGSCFTLTRLILKQNNLTGMVPEFVENSNPLFMDLGNNSFHGSIPLSLGNLVNVTYIDLSLNKLTGHIPPELGHLVQLEELNLSHNGLEGTLPSQLSSCYRLSKLDLSHNLLNGTIPSSLRNLSELSFLDLSENRFRGGVSPSLFQLGKLLSLQLGGNQLGGPIPRSVGSRTGADSLRLLNLSSNGLTGQLPWELGSLKLLEQLDISCNNLSGSLEAINELHSLTEVNVSYNAFTGQIPLSMMQWVISSPSSFSGNPDLCINCRPKGGVSCEGYSGFKSCNIRSRKRGLTRVGIAMIVLGSSLFAVLLVLGISYVFLRHKCHERDFLVTAEEGASSLLHQVMEATENLNDKYVIGRGAHGTVYKVILGPTEVYALKKLTFIGCKGGNTSMVREIQTIGKVRHRNLVKLEDFWLRKEYGLILYSYMKNGSLHDVLHEACPSQPLDWNVRSQIALGTAQGLSYLHFDCDPPIIHRDIKPMNILLDWEMEPHISDFGIAKLLDESVVSATSSVVQGTIGYMAPENAFSTKSGKEADVYAYGVMLLELITRKKVLDPSFGGEMDIVRWVRSVWNETEDVEAIVDPALVDEFIDSSIKEQVKGAILLALRCTEKEPVRRPSMREVVKQLTVSDSRCRSKNGRR